MNTGTTGQTLGALSTTITSNLGGVGSLVVYLFGLVGIVLTGMGLYGFYAAHSSPGGQHTHGKAAVMTIVGLILVGGIGYVISTGSATLGNTGASSNITTLTNP